MTTTTAEIGQAKVIPWVNRLDKAPWWGLVILLLGALIAFSIYASDVYRDTFNFLLEGVGMTVRITLSAYSFAVVLGLILGLGRVSKNVVYYNAATFYVEVMRGVPMLVIILYVAFVLTPILVEASHSLGAWIVGTSLGFLAFIGEPLRSANIRDIDLSVRGVLGLGLGYAAFEAEIFRAGIQSIERGQMEAARSLGMSYFQAMRYIILPQAIRRVLPPLANDFIAMLKDSSLISVLGVRELTQMGVINRGRTFRGLETYNTVASLYLSMTLTLSLFVKFIERRLRTAH